MGNAKTIIDGETVASGGGTAQGSFNLGRADQQLKIYVDGDTNSTSIDVDFYAQPDELSSWFFVSDTGKKGVDVTAYDDNAVVLAPDYQPADVIRVKITNDAASDTVITVKTKYYQP